MSSTPTAPVGQTLGTRPARENGRREEESNAARVYGAVSTGTRFLVSSDVSVPPRRAHCALLVPLLRHGQIPLPTAVFSSHLLGSVPRRLLRPSCALLAPFLRLNCTMRRPSAYSLGLPPLPPKLDEAHPPAFLSLTVLISRRVSQTLWAGRQSRKTRPGCLVYPFVAGVLEYGTVHAVGRQTRQGYLIHPLQPVRTNISPTQCSSTHSRTRARARARRKPTPPPHIQAHPPAIPKSHPTHHHHNPPTHPPTHPPTTRAAGVFHCSNSCRRHLHRRGPGKLHAGPRGCGW